MDKLSVNMYSQRQRCNGDCDFCAWNQGFTPQASERRTRLTLEQLGEEVEYAGRQSGSMAIELMDASVALSRPSFEHYLEVLQHIPPDMTVGIAPGIAARQDWLEKLSEAGAIYYANNLETAPRLFSGLVGTHTQEMKLASLRRARSAGLAIHTGFILGMGETSEDIQSMLDLIRLVEPDGLNINFFYSVAGLQLAKDFQLPPEGEVFHKFLEFHGSFPGLPIYLGAGREAWLRNKLQEAKEMAQGLYIRRFLNHQALLTVLD